MSPINIHVDIIQKKHDRTTFDCGESILNNYLQKSARKNNINNLGRTFVATPLDSQKVIGFFTLSACSIAFDHLPDEAKVGPQGREIPAILLGMLGVDNQYKGQQLGATLLGHAVKKAAEAAESIAAYALVLHALKKEVKPFYLKYGFLELANDPLHLYLPIKSFSDYFESL